jgi:hypothetical protein
MNWRSSRFAAACLTPTLLPIAVLAGTWTTVEDDDWCDEGHSSDYCEVREITLPDRDLISADAGRNGGIHVEAWDKNEIRVRAKITLHDVDADEAGEVASAIAIDTDEQIVARGPEGRDQRWSVSYRLMVPAKSDLALEAHNGGIAIEGVDGDLEFSTQNGGISLANVAGSVHGRTVNGGIEVDLDGAAWKGEGLDVTTTNGGIDLAMPDGYSARLEMATVNGGVHSDLAETHEKSAHSGPKRFAITLGDGGALLRLVTTNGGIQIRET